MGFGGGWGTGRGGGGFTSAACGSPAEVVHVFSRPCSRMFFACRELFVLSRGWPLRDSLRMHVGPGTKARRWAAVPFVAVLLVVDIVGRVLAAPSKGEGVEEETTAPAVPGCSVQRLGVDCLERINDLG